MKQLILLTICFFIVVSCKTPDTTNKSNNQGLHATNPNDPGSVYGNPELLREINLELAKLPDPFDTAARNQAIRSVYAKLGVPIHSMSSSGPVYVKTERVAFIDDKSNSSFRIKSQDNYTIVLEFNNETNEVIQFEVSNTDGKVIRRPFSQSNLILLDKDYLPAGSYLVKGINYSQLQTKITIP